MYVFFVLTVMPVFMQITPGQQGLLDFINKLKVLVVLVMLGIIVICDGWAIIVANFKNQSMEGTHIIRNAIIVTVASFILIGLALSPILPNTIFFLLGASMPTA